MHDTDLPRLAATAWELINALTSFQERLVPGNVWHTHHDAYLDRARHLAMHLGSTLRLADASHYPSAFALLRTALEHHLLDTLLMLGIRYVQEFQNLGEDQIERLRDALDDPDNPIVELTISDTDRVRVVREGLFPENGAGADRYAIPLSYFVMDQYSPFVGSPTEAQHFDDGIRDSESRVAWARDNRSLYEEHLRWRSIKDNLVVNNLLDDADILKLDVHYRFLSAYTHAYSEAYELAFPRGIVGGQPPVRDHYSLELALLYVTVIAAKELRVLMAMAERPPRLGVEGVPDLDALIGTADETAAHLWFPGQPPHEYDRIQEANRISWRQRRATGTLSPPPDPNSLPDHQVGYYDNPLTRLIRLHRSGREMTTGLTYRSPWERQDAMRR